jgi:hypothetical protein
MKMSREKPVTAPVVGQRRRKGKGWKEKPVERADAEEEATAARCFLEAAMRKLIVEVVKPGNSSLPGQARMNNLLKAHIKVMQKGASDR